MYLLVHEKCSKNRVAAMIKEIDSRDDIAKKLRMLRAEFNLTQADVANKLWIAQQTYSKYESKGSNLDSATIVKLCELYGISSDYLLGLDRKKSSVEAQPKPIIKKTAHAKEDTLTESNIKEIVKQVLSEMSEK